MQEAFGWSGATTKEIIPIKITTAKNTSKAKQFITLRDIRIKFKQDVVNRYFQLLGVWRGSVRFISTEYVHVIVRITYENDTKLSTRCWFRCWIWDSNVQSNRKITDIIGMNVVCASPPAAYVAEHFLVNFVAGVVGAWKIWM